MGESLGVFMFIWDKEGSSIEIVGSDGRIVKFISEDELLRYLAEILIASYLENKKYENKNQQICARKTF